MPDEHNDTDVPTGAAGASLRSVQHDASAALQLGDIAKALAVYEAAVARSPSNLQLRIELGFLLWRTYEFERGRQVLCELVEDSRTGISSLKSIAKHFFEAGFYRQAAMTMQVAVERAPGDTVAIELYAGALEREGNADCSVGRIPTLRYDSVRADDRKP